MQRFGFIMSKKADRFIIAVIIINAITLGMETSPHLMENYGVFLNIVDQLALAIFTIEILWKIVYLKGSYFRDPWNIFDFVLVALSYVAIGAGITVMRSLRVLRVLLLVSALPRLRIIVRSLIISLPSIASITLLLVLIFYVSAVVATRLFGAAFPAWFGSIGESLFTLFQLMTLESWAMGIVRPVSEVYPYAPAFFVPFVLLSAFIILNVFIAVIISAMNEAREQFVKTLEKNVANPVNDEDLEKIFDKLSQISSEIEGISTALRNVKLSRRE